MKKLLLIGALSLALTSCDIDLIEGDEYTKVHILGQKCFEITDYQKNKYGGVNVKTKQYGWVFVSEGNYMLIEDKCPICDYKY